MEDIKLSIIIPCFNSFHMMNQSLEFFSQNPDESFELIVVDDCSTDESYELLQQYAISANFPMTVVRNSHNCGPGGSRNRGIQEAKGQYISFLDADDFYTDEYFKEVFPHLNGVNDCVIYDFKFLYDNGKEWTYSSFFKDLEEGYVDSKKATAFVRGSTCGKIYKKALVAEKKLQFLDQRRYEDMPFTKSVISYCEHIVYIKLPLYVYVLHNNSLTHNDSLFTIDNVRNAYEYVLKHLNPDMVEEKKTIFAVEYLASSALIAIKQKSRKEWIEFVKTQEHICEGYASSRYLKEYAKSKQVEINLIKNKAYYLLRLFLILKERVK